MQLEEFKQRFHKLRDKGYVPSLRSGPTGVGHTFEFMMGLGENNLALPDIEGVEVKAHRTHSNSLVTLFTFNRGAWQVQPLEAIKKYGSRDDDGRLGIYYTLSSTPNNAGLFLTVGENDISAQHTSGEVVATWKLQDLAERFAQKIPALLLVSAHAERHAGTERFHYYRMQLMQGTAGSLFADLFKTGILMVDFRLHDAGTRARNHGTGFRIAEGNLPLLFTNVEDI